jgi:adhesin transport system membrane fusion protein
MNQPSVPRAAQETMQPDAIMPPGAGKPTPHSEPAQRTRKAFEQLGKAKAPGQSLFDRFFDRLLPALPDSQQLDWGDEADWARLQQEPLRARWLLWVVVSVVVLLLVWAAFAPLDEVVRGEGKVIPSSKERIVQALNPGWIEEILVKEGEIVEKDQVLLRIDTSRIDSEFQVTVAERLPLMARVACLQALLDSRVENGMMESRDCVIPGEVLKEKPDAAARELEYYRTTIAEANALRARLQLDLVMRERELSEAEVSHASAVDSLKYAKKERDKSAPLVPQAVSEIEFSRLEANVSKFDGERKAAIERIGRAKAAVNEALSKIEENEHTLRNKWNRELDEVSRKLATVNAGAGVSEDKKKHAEVRSPVRGTVNRLRVNTGEVVAMRDELAAIVPLGEDLLLETKIKPKDIGFLSIKQPARVKITAYDFSIYGGLDGVLEGISPNTVTDEKGNTFYVIKVRTHESTIGKDKKPIAPGMVAEVDVLTGKKTVLSYLLKPVLRAKQNAMTEK